MEEGTACWAMEVGSHRLAEFQLLKEGTAEEKEGHGLRELDSRNC